jgi:hypothetical protein
MRYPNFHLFYSLRKTVLEYYPPQQQYSISHQQINTMCQNCPAIAPADAACVLLEVKQHLKFLEGSINEYLSHHLDLEDEYRKAGIRYHCTQASARQPTVFSEAHLLRFEWLFENTDVEEYNVHLEPLFAIMAELTDLRDEYVRYYGTTEELYHRVYIDIKPKYESLILDWLVLFCEELEETFDAASEFYDLSRKCHETDRTDRRIAWHDSVPVSTGTLEPRSQGEEWYTYHAWVGSLPETERAHRTGRDISEAALDMLYNVPEGFEPETY